MILLRLLVALQIQSSGCHVRSWPSSGVFRLLLVAVALSYCVTAEDGIAEYMYTRANLSERYPQSTLCHRATTSVRSKLKCAGHCSRSPGTVGLGFEDSSGTCVCVEAISSGTCPASTDQEIQDLRYYGLEGKSLGKDSQPYRNLRQKNIDLARLFSCNEIVMKKKKTVLSAYL